MNKRSLYLRLLPLVLVVLLTGCEGQQSRFQADFLGVFDTVVQVTGYAKNQTEFTKEAEWVQAELQTYHELYDIYHEYEGINNIKTINDNAGKQPVKIDPKLMELLVFGKEIYHKTSGKVNIAFGSVLQVWHRYREEGIDAPLLAKLPSDQELEEASDHTDINQLILDQDAGTAYLEDAKMSLDVGAIAKGYAVERVCQTAQAKGINNMLLSVGGNVRAIGGKLSDSKLEIPWNVGIQNPDNNDESPYIEKLELQNASLVTSGNYQRYYTVDGKAYHHIIDPETLQPANYFTAVSIVCEDSGMADALSTALYNMDYESGNSLIEQFDGAKALWVMQDGTQIYTEGFENYIVK